MQFWLTSFVLYIIISKARQVAMAMGADAFILTFHWYCKYSHSSKQSETLYSTKTKKEKQKRKRWRKIKNIFTKENACKQSFCKQRTNMSVLVLLLCVINDCYTIEKVPKRIVFSKFLTKCCYYHIRMFVARVKVLIPANQMPSICMVVDDIPFYVKFKLLKTETAYDHLTTVYTSFCSFDESSEWVTFKVGEEDKQVPIALLVNLCWLGVRLFMLADICC